MCIGGIEIEVCINERLAAQNLYYTDNCLCRCPRTVIIIVLVVNTYVIGTNTEYDLMCAVHILNGDLIGLDVLHIYGSAAIERKLNVLTRFGNGTVEKVHLRCADKAGNEHIIGIFVKIDGGIDLLNVAVLHNNDTGAHGHCLYLVVGNVDKGCTELFVQARDLGSHCGTQLCIQVGKGLVKQKHLGLTNDGTSECNSLTLTAGECLGLSFEILGNAEDLCSFHYLFVNLIIGHMNGAQ